MNGETGTAPDTRADDEQIFARPAWLADFTEPGTAPVRARAPERASEPALDEWRDDAEPPTRAPIRGGRTEDDFWDPEPAGWRATVDRVRTTPRAALALVAVGVIAAVVAAVAVFGSSDGAASGEYPVVNFAGASSAVGAPTSVPGSAPAGAPSGGAVPPAAAPPALVVAVVGMVRAPGLHRLKAGARVADALGAARGTLGGADTASLNLAQPLRDGDQVVVGVVDQKAGVKLRSSVVSAGAPAAGAGAAAPDAGAPGAARTTGAAAGPAVNINTAGATELDRLPGVGAATAAAIIAYRDKNGPFGSVDDLAKVSGIGTAKLAKIKPMATV